MKKQIVANGIHNYTPPEEYIPPRSAAVQKHLDWFMGLKLGFMMHWAPDCQLGTYESWPLSDGDAAWSQEDFTWADRETCKRQYWEANKTFNPVKFDPAAWAALAKECGFKYLQFIPCLRPLGSKEEGELYMTNEQYAHFLTALFRLYVHDMERGDYVSIRRFDNWVRMLRGEQFEECGVGGFCTRQFVVEANGNVYPCDFYCLDKWLLGNINTRSFEQMARSPLAQNFIASSFIMPSRCANCEYFDLCRGGGCKRAHTSYDYCSAYKEFFASAKEDFARLTKHI